MPKYCVAMSSSWCASSTMARAHARDIAVIEVWAVGADAILRAGSDLVPEVQVLGQFLDLGAVAGLSLLAPLLEQIDVVRVVARAEGGAVGRGFQASG